jgi:hypothetical protein
MTVALYGMTVARGIPLEVYEGLTTGLYKLHGGVIRWAPGTEFGGQIVRHLIPLASQSSNGPIIPVNAYQLQRVFAQLGNLEMATQQVLQIATGTMVLSGLNLAVSAVGFAVINQKLDKLEDKLSQIQQEVRAIREMLELKERSELKAALRDLIHVMEISDAEHRRTLLFNSKNVLAPVSLRYKELLASANTIETAMAFEEYFSLTALAHARCVAELGMLGMARRDLRETKDFWKVQARRIVNDMLFGDAPERFLFSDFVEDVPVSILVDWYDFAYAEDRGYGWIDDLRAKTKPWYAPETVRNIKAEPGRVISSLGKMVSRQSKATPAIDLTVDKDTVIPSIQKLVARNNVMEGYGAQYELLETHNTTPAEFESKVALLANEAAVDGYLILEPAELQAM